MKKIMWLSLMALVSSTSFAGYDAVNLITQVKKDENKVLVADSVGKTLYVFDLDKEAALPKCNADCAEVWPPYLITEEEAATVKAPLGVIARANKKMQLTYDGRPVYTYIFDRSQGDDKGDGLGGVWHDIELEE